VGECRRGEREREREREKGGGGVVDSEVEEKQHSMNKEAGEYE
jgi:hypothetical protein